MRDAMPVLVAATGSVWIVAVGLCVFSESAMATARRSRGEVTVSVSHGASAWMAA